MQIVNLEINILTQVDQVVLLGSILNIIEFQGLRKKIF